MDVMSLMATIGLDDSGFTSGLSGARSAFGDFKDLVGKGVEMTVDVLWDFGKDVVNTGIGFDREMSAVQAVLGKDGTVETMQKLRSEGLKQARQSIFTSEEVADAYYYMGMAGWDATQMTAGLPGILNLAAASGDDLRQTSDIVTDSITAFGLTANDVSRYTDILAATATNANTDVAKMGQTFQYVAPIAGALGFDVEDVAASIGIMANAGIKGSKAGTALRNIFTRISTDTNNARTTLEKLGVTIYYNNGKMREWRDIVSDSRAVWRNLSDEQQISYAKTIAGQYGMAGWLALMNASEEEYSKLSNEIINSNGAAANMSANRLDNLWGDLQMLQSSYDVLKITIFDDVKGPLREIVQWGTDAIDRINDAISEDGLEGGIRQLGIEIETAGEKFAPMFEALGTALGPLFQAVFESVLPAILDTSISVGTQFADGFFTGVADALKHTDNPILRYLGDTLSQGVDDAHYWHDHDMVNGAGSLTSMALASRIHSSIEVKTVTIGGVEVNAQDVQKAIDEAGDGYWVTIGNETVSLDFAEQLREDLGGTITQTTDNGFSYLWQAADVNLPNLANYAVGLLSGAGDKGGFNLFNNVGLQAFSIIPTIASYVAGSIGASGTSAGYDFGNRFQAALRQFGVNVTTNMLGNFRRYASATNEGRILNGATVFGVDSAGRSLIGGEAGQEAVIGTRSLQRMIYDSTRKALSNVGGTTVNINITQQPGQSAADLAHEIQREFIRMEREGRTIYA